MKEKKGVKKTKKKNDVGRPTKYTKELAEAIATDLSHMPLKEACKKNGIDDTTYYQWLYKHPEFSRLSTEARKTKAVKHFTACEEILEELKRDPDNPDTRSDIARLRLDFHLRLAGKANQGLFEKEQVSNTQSIIIQSNGDKLCE